MTSKLNHDGMFLFEQPFVKVPYENYRKVFRTAQKNVEHEMGSVLATEAELLSKSSAKTLAKEDAAKSIDSMIGRVQSLKRKLSDLQEIHGMPTQEVIRQRLQHLSTVESLQSANEPEFSRWADVRLDRWLVDWCLRNGKDRTARLIAKEKCIESLVDIDLFADISRIESAISQHSCTEALSWCTETKSALRKIKSTLEFELRLQEYIELARQRKIVEAIAYSKKHLISWQDSHLSQIREASALLAFRADTTCGPYKRLYDLSRWNVLVKSFRDAIYNLHTLPSEPLLHLALYAGLASLKLPACYDAATKNVDCPVCDGENNSPGLGILAAEVPFSHHANSTIVCRITGKIVDGNNMPLAFPNGYIYSREALEDMAAKNNGMVTCPRSNTTCEFSELRKVFIS